MKIVTIARKSFSGSATQNAVEHGCGALNIDGSRIPTEDNLNGGAYAVNGKERYDGYDNWRYKREGGAGSFVPPSGRWPANLILQHKPDCVMKGDVWDCVEDCPVVELDNQSGASKFFKQVEGEDDLICYLKNMISPPNKYEPVVLVLPNLADYDWSQHKDQSVHGLITIGNPESHLSEIDRVLLPAAHVLVISDEEDQTGSFAACALEDFGYEIRDAVFVLDSCDNSYYVAKPSKNEKNAGVSVTKTENGEHQNNHPTVKPIAVMTAIMEDIPSGSTVVDAFMGSGTTGIACLRGRINFVGIEQDESHVKTATERIRHWDQVFNLWNLSQIESEIDLPEDTSEKKKMSIRDLFGL